MERTLLIIKPDGVERNLIGAVLGRVERAGFRIRELKMVGVSEAQAGEFYRVHQGKAFYDALVSYISSGSVVVASLEKENAVAALRELAGATDPKKASPGTLRYDLGLDIQKNTVHASDSAETAEKELRFFFSDSESRNRE